MNIQLSELSTTTFSIRNKAKQHKIKHRNQQRKPYSKNIQAKKATRAYNRKKSEIEEKDIPKRMLNEFLLAVFQNLPTKKTEN